MVLVKTIREPDPCNREHLHDQPGKVRHFSPKWLKRGQCAKRHSILLHWLDYDFSYAWDKNEEGDEQNVSGERGYRRRGCVCSAVAIIRKDRSPASPCRVYAGAASTSPTRRPMDRLKGVFGTHHTRSYTSIDGVGLESHGHENGRRENHMLRVTFFFELCTDNIPTSFFGTYFDDYDAR